MRPSLCLLRPATTQHPTTWNKLHKTQQHHSMAPRQSSISSPGFHLPPPTTAHSVQHAACTFFPSSTHVSDTIFPPHRLKTSPELPSERPTHARCEDPPPAGVGTTSPENQPCHVIHVMDAGVLLRPFQRACVRVHLRVANQAWRIKRGCGMRYTVPT